MESTVRFKIEGLNQDRLIKRLNQKGITLKNVIKKSNKIMFLSVKQREIQNFFAITENMCYNITKVKEFGFIKIKATAIKNAGLILGAIVFFIVAVLSQSFIFGFTFTGSGSVYSEYLTERLNEAGVTKYGLFNNTDLKSASYKILTESDRFSYLTLKKRGAYVVVDSALSDNAVKKDRAKVYSLISTVEGVVESVTVYRGTASVVVGDKVKKGSELVGGFIAVKDGTFPVDVLATVIILTEKDYKYKFNYSNCESDAVAFLTGEFDGGRIKSINKTQESDGWTVTVRVEYPVKITSC